MGSDDITEHFDLNSDGNVIVFPLIGFKSALVGGYSVWCGWNASSRTLHPARYRYK